MFTPGIISIVVVVVVGMSEFLLCTEAQKNTHTHTHAGVVMKAVFLRARVEIIIFRCVCGGNSKFDCLD